MIRAPVKAVCDRKRGTDCVCMTSFKITDVVPSALVPIGELEMARGEQRPRAAGWIPNAMRTGLTHQPAWAPKKAVRGRL
eukprot:627086-Prymnesium_polylepis.1